MCHIISFDFICRVFMLLTAHELREEIIKGTHYGKCPQNTGKYLYNKLVKLMNLNATSLLLFIVSGYYHNMDINSRKMCGI
jgi:hypothetical protein